MARAHGPMCGRTCLVTGGTAGIGRVTARELAHAGGDVIIVGRNGPRGETVAREIREETGNERVHFVRVDLSTQADAHRLAREFAEAHDRLDVLVNNVGAIFNERRESVDGLEMTFALNHLGYFLTTNLLLDRLRASDAARIVVVSSRAHVGSRIDFDDLQMRRGYSGWRAYQRSKLANLYFTYALSERLREENITVNALHPGFVRTEFGSGNAGLFRIGLRLAMLVSAIDVEKGAETPVWLATAPEVAGRTGGYFVDCREAEPSPAALDVEARERLWEVSERMTGLR